MLVPCNFDCLSVEIEQTDDPAYALRCQAGVGVEGKSVPFREVDNTATGIVVVVMCLEAAFGRDEGVKVFVEVVMSTIFDGVPVRFAICK